MSDRRRHFRETPRWEPSRHPPGRRRLPPIEWIGSTIYAVGVALAYLSIEFGFWR